jgi:hypothetical protein
VFRATRPDAPRPFKTWGDPVTPALFVLAASGIVASVIRVSPVQSMIGAGLMVAGVPAFYYWTASAKATARQAASAKATARQAASAKASTSAKAAADRTARQGDRT